jgi:hypothetical protein
MRISGKMLLMTDRDHIHVNHPDFTAMQEKIEQLKEENVRLKRAELEMRDLVIGVQAQVEELEHRLRTQSLKHTQEIDSIKTSWSWRVGQIIVSPFSKIRSFRSK